MSTNPNKGASDVKYDSEKLAQEWRDLPTEYWPYKKVLQDRLTALEKVAEEMAGALEFYADRKNWMRSWIGNNDGEVIPSKWADKLKEQDCAMLNCGGGRARLAIEHYRKFKESNE